MCVVVSEFVGYLNAPRLGRRGLVIVFDAGACKEYVVEVFVDSNIVILGVVFAECKCVWRCCNTDDDCEFR